ncbi:DNA gyrase subunit A [Limnoglobus roseus]|uniref:DNA topoisomerase (ATP-hydrolyzing) n=1 Tax=Limnoglobus roseus TaxID=2598579 RepID=A0A5C1ASS6_9BACT|nr:DNA gyrase subunit A [Limnoglobus roseus]QEL20304.1 DNA gyrase subunit A [Limnoglobus roseus]
MAKDKKPPVPPDDGTTTALVPDAPITPIDIADELQSSYLAYAQSVMVSRALPDVRDGLKPSQRRILVAMNDLGLSPSSSTSKCAGIIGETMKRYHPHGDASIYATLVRMAQDWVMRAKLIHGQGNFGSIAGLPPAAHRYTEARLTNVAADMLDDLENETVDFIDNYDGKYREPLVLPSKFPNLLVNGSDGIAVGMATDIPPHNLGEVCTGLIRLIDEPDVPLIHLLEIIPGPDFPTGGIIMGKQGIADGYRGVRSRIQLRARADIIEEGKGKSPSILIREVPYSVNRNKLAADIGELVKNDRIAGITGIRDESSARSGEPVRLVVELKKGTDPHLVLNQLYQYSPLQSTVSIGLLALVEGRAHMLSLKEMMQKFLDHRVVVIRRRTQYLLREAKRRSHVLEGQLIAMSSLDEVIRIIRAAPSRAEAKVQLQEMVVAASVLQRALGDEGFATLQRELGLTETYQMTEQQAEAVVRLQLGQLANLERDEILKEFKTLRDQIRGYEELLANESLVNAIIRKDLEDARDKYGTPRRTEISNEGGDVDLEDLIVDEPNVVTMTHEGFLKRMPLDTYRVQGRGGKGVQGGTRENDFVEHFFVASTKAYLLCFTDKGQCYWLRVFNIPLATRTSAGRSIANVLQLKTDEKITSIIPVRNFEGDFSLTMATRRGLVKKTPLADYSRPRAGGIIGINLEDGDRLMDVALTKIGDEIVLSTRNGMAIRFAESDAREVGRNSKGVKGINVVKDDEVVGMVVADPDGYLLTVCENGYGKRTPFGPNTAGEATEDEVEEAPAETADENAETSPSAMRYRKQRRGGKGVRDIKTSERNGKVIAVVAIRDGDDVMLISKDGMVTRSKVEDIRIVGRNTQGVRVMNLNENDKLATLAKVASENIGETTAVEAVNPV